MIHLVKIAAALGFVTLGSILTSPTRTGIQYVDGTIWLGGREIGTLRNLSLKRRKGGAVGEIARMRINKTEWPNIFILPAGSNAFQQQCPVDIVIKSKKLTDVMFSPIAYTSRHSEIVETDYVQFDAASFG